MNRRIAIRQLGFITAGVMLLPSCVKPARPVSIALKHLSISGDQESMLAEIVDTIIPATDIPGGKQMNLQAFVLRMVDDCQTPEAQKNFETGLASFEDEVKKKYSKSFEECTPGERKSFLLEIDKLAKADRQGKKENPLTTFYSMTKRYTMKGFTNSEYVMTNIFAYNMLPGKFLGCVQIKDKNDVKTIMG
ncbi:MAG: gluconate 2-dehydrogenase subunit 3 family protein [Chryseolinea sp.]